MSFGCQFLEKSDGEDLDDNIVRRILNIFSNVYSKNVDILNI